jgi:uncharacterized membrane protein YsdA (DUF1294 family)
VTHYIIYWLLTANALAFTLMVIDKQRAVTRKRRIPESTLLLWAFLGGGIGCFAASRWVRHKTHKQPFAAIMVFFLVAELILLTLWALGLLNPWLALLFNSP